MTVLVRTLALGSLTFGLTVASVSATIARSTGRVDVTVLKSRDAPPYDQVLDGFRRQLANSGVDARYTVHSSEGEEVDPVLRACEKRTGQIVLALGSAALRKASAVLERTPIVAALVVGGGEIEQAANATGVLLDYPVDVELRWLRRLLPDHRKVGVLFNPRENGAKIAQATRLAKKLGLSLINKEVPEPRDIPRSLRSLERHADILWGIADHTVFSPQTAKQFLVFSFRNRIPLSGLSASWVKAGALYSLERDYVDIGAQSGELAVRILRGASLSSLPPVPPRKVLYTLNLKTARHMRLDLSAAVIEGASDVFE